jgi:5-methylcytosine-specific restriction endonuclease McrA
MPSKPNKIKRSWVQERKPFEREESNSAFYNSWTWRKLRKKFIEKNPLCVHCAFEDITTKATVVDHIQPIRLGGEPLKEFNLQSLCEMHHNRKSSSEARKGGMG